MAEKSLVPQDQVDELLRQATSPNSDLFNLVLLDAKRGIDDPASLTPLEVQRVCFALAALFA